MTSSMKILVTSKNKFLDTWKDVEKTGEWVAISIEDTPNDWCHLVNNDDRVLNVEFDDADMSECGLYPITEETAKKIYEFALSHIDKNILIHCNAGISRSQGVAEALSSSFPAYWKTVNPSGTPNIFVSTLIKRLIYLRAHEDEEFFKKYFEN